MRTETRRLTKQLRATAHTHTRPIIQSTRKLSSICANSILPRAWRPTCNFRTSNSIHMPHSPRHWNYHMRAACIGGINGPHAGHTNNRCPIQSICHAASHASVACLRRTNARILIPQPPPHCRYWKIACTQYTSSLCIQTSDSTRLCLCLQSPSEKSDARNQYNGWVFAEYFALFFSDHYRQRIGLAAAIISLWNDAKNVIVFTLAKI